MNYKHGLLHLQPIKEKFVLKFPFTMPGVYRVSDTLVEGS